MLEPAPDAAPDAAPAGLSWDGCVRNANASFSDLNGIVSWAPDSSPSVTSAALAPGYLAASSALALAMSAALNPEIDVPEPPCMSDLGKRNFRPTVAVPSALNVVLTS